MTAPQHSEVMIYIEAYSSSDHSESEPLITNSKPKPKAPTDETVARSNSDKTFDMLSTGKRNDKNLPSHEIDGLQAWLTLTCIFITNATTLGSLKIYGLIFEEIVAQKYYTREEASWPISTASTMQNLAGLLTPILATKISWRSIEVIQVLLFVAANVGAYFSNNLALDIFCLGIVQGVALSIRYNMNVVINNEYFVKYRATAMGISLAGSTFGAFLLEPIISHILDNSQHSFRNAYLALGVIMSSNILLSYFIRKPQYTPIPSSRSESIDENTETTTEMSIGLLRNPGIHCIWIMQTIYFYISRTYTIFIVDYGLDKGFSRPMSRHLLDFWVYGEFVGRLLLGGLVDSKLMSLKLNIAIVNLVLALFGFALLIKPAIVTGTVGAVLMAIIPNLTADRCYFWLFGLSVSSIGALSSLVNMLIVPYGQEYLGKKNVPWAFAMGSVVTSIFLLFRPSLIGWSRDQHKSYDLLIIVMSSVPFVYALLFLMIEPLFKRYKYIEPKAREIEPSLVPLTR